jgi:hypothetical protein
MLMGIVIANVNLYLGGRRENIGVSESRPRDFPHLALHHIRSS